MLQKPANIFCIYILLCLSWGYTILLDNIQSSALENCICWYLAGILTKIRKKHTTYSQWVCHFIRIQYICIVSLRSRCRGSRKKEQTGWPRNIRLVRLLTRCGYNTLWWFYPRNMTSVLCLENSADYVKYTRLEASIFFFSNGLMYKMQKNYQFFKEWIIASTVRNLKIANFTRKGRKYFKSLILVFKRWWIYLRSTYL